MARNGTYAVYVNSGQRLIGNKATMLKEGKALGRSKSSGQVSVWELDTDGKRIGRRPLFSSFNGKVKIKP